MLPRLNKRPGLAAATLAFVLSVAGCQVLVDLDGLEDQHCGPTKKACPNVGCVPNDNPATSCNDPTCVPCAPAHAIAICSQTLHCSFDRNSCLTGFADCDGLPDTGCETDLAHTPEHCGDCLHVCEKPLNGVAGCSNGQCMIRGCNPGWEDCDHNPANGCEHPIWTDLECLACDLPCQAGTHCNQGACE
jgi:hypothetical protein